MTEEERELVDQLVHCTDKAEEKKIIMKLVPEAKEKLVDIYVEQGHPLEDSWMDDVMSTPNKNKRYKLIRRNFEQAPKEACLSIADIAPYVPLNDEEKLYVEKTFEYKEEKVSPYITEQFTKESWEALPPKQRYVYTAMMRDPDITPEEAEALVDRYIKELKIEKDVYEQLETKTTTIREVEFHTYRLCLQTTAYVDRIAVLYDKMGFGRDPQDCYSRALEHFVNSLKNHIMPNHMLKAIISSDPEWESL